jgi:membrane protein DedA with SNARE-associated domain
LADLVTQYGYWAVLAGTLLEGETILALAGYAAYRGHLALPGVIAVAFVGSTLGDQFFFFIGRRFGKGLLERSTRLQRQAIRIDRLLVRHHGPLIIGVRFAYGLRIAGPIVIGMSNLSTSRFLFFNAIGALLWAPLVAAVGYLFGKTLDWLLVDLQKYEFAGFVILLVVLGAIAIVGHLRRRGPGSGGEA